MKTFSEFMEEIMEFTALKKRMDKGTDAKKRRREANKDYKRNKIKINIARKKKKKKDQNLIITELPQLDSGFDVLHKNYYSV